MLKKIRLLLSILIPALLIWWMMATKPWEELIPRLVGKSPWPVIWAIIINFTICFPIKTFKWRSVLANRPRFLTIYGAVLEGATANIIVGFGMNDLVRSYRLRARDDSFATDMGAALTDRLCEYLALMVIFCAAIILNFVPFYWAILPILYIAFVILLSFFQEGFIQKFNRFPKIQAFLRQLSRGLQWETISKLTFLSLLNWLVELIMIYLVMYFLGLPTNPSIVLMVLIGINLAISVPGPPANIGTFEAGAVAALALAGVGHAAAFSFGIFYHLIHAVPVAVVGGLVWVGKDIVRSFQKETIKNSSQ